MTVTCEKEFGSWTIRLNGLFIANFWSEKKARRFAMNLIKVLKDDPSHG